MKNKIVNICILSFLAFTFWSCAKFLDAKPDNTLSHPNTLKDLRAILDNEDFVNHVYPALIGMTTDEFEIKAPGYYSLHEIYRNTYIWEDKGDDNGPWTASYRAISLANVVLESLDRIQDKNTKLSNQLKGEALFLRGWVFFHLAQTYCPPYFNSSQNEGLGLVLRMDSDSQIKMGRSTLKETYAQIFSDLTTALELLPEESEYITRPSKLVCLAALARVYLIIEDYKSAELMTDQLLAQKNQLLDYSTLDDKVSYPFTLQNNTELLYYGRTSSSGAFISNASNYIDQALYQLYDEHDLRKKVYFNKGADGMKFRGFYHGGTAVYSAVLAMDEVYLTKAECLARRGEVIESLKYLNTLRQNRFEADFYTPLLTSDQEESLSMVLEERQRQLVCRGTRWSDLRRLNQDPRFKKTLERRISDGKKEEVYILEPNDLRYTFLIPNEAIRVGNYIQNPR